MSIRAGVGTRAMNLPDGCLLFGHPGFRRPATGTHDPLLVSALHLRTGVHGALFISLDLYGLEAYLCDRIVNAVADATGVHKDRIFIGCTQTHSGPGSVWSYAWKDDTLAPGPDSVFLESAAQTVVAAAAEACATTRPVTLGQVAASLPDQQDPAPSETTTLAFRQDDGAYAAFLTVSALPPALIAPENTLVSADFPFFFRERIEERLGADIATVHFTAPSAGLALPHRPDDDPFAAARSAGHTLADATLKALDKAPWKSFDDSVEIVFCKTTTTLPFRAFPEDLSPLEQAAATPEPGPPPADERERAAWRALMRQRAHAQAILNLARQKERGIFDQIAMVYGTAEARRARLGNLTLVGLPGNPAPGIADRLKQKLPGDIWVAAHIGGFLQGDIMTPEQEAANLFGAMPSPFASNGVQAMADALSKPQVT